MGRGVKDQEMDGIAFYGLFNDIRLKVPLVGFKGDGKVEYAVWLFLLQSNSVTDVLPLIEGQHFPARLVSFDKKG